MQNENKNFLFMNVLGSEIGTPKYIELSHLNFQMQILIYNKRFLCMVET